MTRTDRDHVEAKVAVMLERVRVRRALAAELHAKQAGVYHSKARRIAALCARRSGKTEMDARVIARDLEKCVADEWVIYAAVTRSLAKDLIWGRLAAINDRHQLGWKMLEHEGRIIAPRGGQFRVLGFDKLPELEKTRGYKTRLAVFDEPATYVDKLEGLLEKCIEPALGDLDGQVLVNGTPGEVCAGWWYEASTGLKPGWETHAWTVRDNPMFPRDPDAYLAAVLASKSWTPEHATFRREYLGEWVNDPDALVYAFLRDRNLVQTCPVPFDPADWTVTIGIDYGYHPDPCAWAVMGSPPHSTKVYVLESFAKSELLPDEAADITRDLVRRYRPVSVVGDAGGSGKAYVEEWNRRWAEQTGTTVKPAAKLDKEGAVELLNGGFRSAEVVICADRCGDYVSEVQYLPWQTTGLSRREHPAYGNHCCDAALYAYREHQGFWHRPAPPPVVVPHLRLDDPDLIEEEAARMISDAARPWWDR